MRFATPLSLRGIFAAIVISLGAVNAQASGPGEYAPSEGDVGLLFGLGQLEARYDVAAELYATGSSEQATEFLETAHHGSYEDVAPELKARKIPGFERELRALEKAVMEDLGAEVVAEAHEEVRLALSDSRARIHADSADLFAASVALLRDAGEEFSHGVEDGRIIEHLEYQDAWGFAHVARGVLDELAASEDAGIAAKAKRALVSLEVIEPLWPSLTQDATRAGGDASILWGAAARVEIAALD